MLKWQIGDSLDIAIIICSFLIGSGYDAYVVQGKANKSITTKNESELDCPFLEQPNQDSQIKLVSEVKVEKRIRNQFFIEKPEKIVSKVDKAKESEKIINGQLQILASKINDDEPERKGKDEHFGERIHFWVYLKKDLERGVTENLLVDPPTCTTWTLQDKTLPFYSI